MQVRVKLFVTFRQYLPAGSEKSACDLDVPPGTRVQDLLLQFGVPIERPEVVAILVNGRHGPIDQVLQEGDVLAAFPAMAGG